MTESRGAGRSVQLTLAALVLLAFALAYLSPVRTEDTDGAIALLAAQALLDHGSLSLEGFRGDPRLAYDLEGDYRLRKRFGGTYYYSLGVPLLSAPAVWLSNRLGWHMLDQKREFALQNLLSALACAALLWALYGLCRAFAAPWPSLVIAAVSMFGSSLVSTLATGLWNSAYAIVLLTLALLHLARRDAGLRARVSYPYLAVLLGVAFLCRPAVGVFGLALLVYLLGEADRRIVRLAGAALGVVGALFVLAWLDLADWIPFYYSPEKLFEREPVWKGLGRILLSPSRGLLVFSPFLVVLAAGLASRWRAVVRTRLMRMAVVWIAVHLVLVAVKGMWWGGHCYGPRILADLMPAFALLTCGTWRELTEAPTVRRWVFVYALLAMPALLVHSYQGLFNVTSARWNRYPNIDLHPQYLWSWKYPQFLADDDSLERRMLEIQRHRAGVYELGEELVHDSSDAIFVRWHQVENGWRWSRGGSPEVRLRLGLLDPEEPYLLRLRAGAHGRQEARLKVNGRELGFLFFEDFAPRSRWAVVPPGTLFPGVENVISFELPGVDARVDDERALGLAFRSLALESLPEDFGTRQARFDDEVWWLEGFSYAEERWRWTDGRLARFVLPLGALETDGNYRLRLRAGALGFQRAKVRIHGKALGDMSFAGFEPQDGELQVPASVLRPFALNVVELELPDASPPPGERRQLALAIFSAELSAADRSESAR